MRKNKDFNKILAVILVIISIFSMVSCSKNKQESFNSQESQSNEESVKETQSSSSEQYPIENNFKSIKRIGPNEETIRQIVSSHDGLSFFILSENWLCEYDMNTTELKSQFNLTEAIKQKLVQKGDVAIQNSFLHWLVTSLTGESGEFYVVADSIGNLFKLKKNEQTELEVCDDYSLVEFEAQTDEKTGKVVEVYTPKEIKGLDVIQDTNQMFALTIENNFFHVEEYDMSDLTKGVINKKFLWDLGLNEKDGYKEITAVKKHAGVLGFYAHGDQIIFVKTGGGIIRMSTDLKDTTYNGGIEFFDDAKSVYEEAKKAEAEYIVAYNEAYINEMSSKIKGIIASKDPTNLENKKTASDIDNIANNYLSQDFGKRVALEDLADFDVIYEHYAMSSQTRSSHKNAAKHKAEKALGDVKIKVDWYKDYDEERKTLYVKEDLFDASCYASFIPGAFIGGVVCVKQNDALYYTNLSDGYLYTVDVDKLKTAELGATISDLLTKVENIHCKAGQMFNTFGNGLCYNSFANTLYITFDNKSDVQIVDLNDKNNYQVIGEYKGFSNMVYFLGDKENTIMHVLRRGVEIEGDRQVPYLYLSTIELNNN